MRCNPLILYIALQSEILPVHRLHGEIKLFAFTGDMAD